MRSIKSLYTNERIFRLSLDDGQTMAEESAAPGPIEANLSYNERVHLEEDVIAALLIGDDTEGDYWYWQVASAAEMIDRRLRRFIGDVNRGGRQWGGCASAH